MTARRQTSNGEYTTIVLTVSVLFGILFVISQNFGSPPPISQEDLAQLEKGLAVDSEDPAQSTYKEGSSSALATTVGEDGELKFKLCLDKASDFIPCLDNEHALKKLRSRKHYEHRERHCPVKGDPAFLDCLIPLPQGYKAHVAWPESRDEVWYANVPHPQLASYKADQNWIKAEGERFIFPGGGTQFKHGATQYIEWLQKSVPGLTWGKHVRVALDMGCGVASFAAYLEAFETRVMSVAPKDEHEAQIQFALERGISALLGVMGTMRQPYPSNVYDIVHCARCRVPWHKEGGKLLLELNRLIRPGGYFVWSATPVCPECKAKEPDDKEVWEAMADLTPRMCWKMVAKVINVEMGIGVAVFQKPKDNKCYDSRPQGTEPPMCPDWDNADAAWYVPMEPCIHRIPQGRFARGKVWPKENRQRWTEAPFWLHSFPRDERKMTPVLEFERDAKHWQRVSSSYLNKVGVDWSTVRNVMDVDAHYGGFGASITHLPVWSMNVVPVNSPDTLPIIFDRGLLGVYHDWCESFNTYPRTYDLLHCDHFLGEALESSRCELSTIMLEFDRILRPGGFVIVREHKNYAATVHNIATALHWKLKRNATENVEVLLSYEKTFWRPTALAS